MNRADLTLPPRTRMAVAAAGVLFHLLVLFALVRAFAPDFTAQVADRLARVITIDISQPQPEREASGDAGTAGAEGRKAKPKAVSAPEPEVHLARKPAPKAASTGKEYESGARDTGEGTGAGGAGRGAGAGNGGMGQGGGMQTLAKISGDINSARDYPKKSRKLREGQSVTIQMSVGADGRASNCRIVTPSPDPEADRITCELAVERFRFRPRTNARGIPVPGEYRWQQRWWDPRD